MAMWEFSHSAGKACCANRLQVWALPNKHALGQSAHWSLSHSHAAAAPEEPLLRCVNKSGENNPCGVKYFRPAVDLCQCCNLSLSFSHLSGHEPLATRDLRNRTRIQQGKKKKTTKKPQMFSRMFESCQMGVHYFFPRLRNVLGNISGTGTSPGLYFPVMWRGASSAKEMSHQPWSWLFQLLMVIWRWAAIWRLPGTLPV